MKNKLFQWNFDIDGLIPGQVQLKKKVWLKKGELLLKKEEDKLIAYLLDDDKDTFRKEEKIIPYLWMSCLISSNVPDLSGGGGVSIASKKELGTKPPLYSSMSISLPEEAVGEIENYAPRYLGFIGRLHDKYIDIVTENEFLKFSLEYFYEAQKKSVYSNEGLISAAISLEALFNEGPSDIKYKLAHRAGFLLGLSDVEPTEAFEKLQAFYNKRNNIVHGRGHLPYDPDRHLVSSYTRKAIILFLILLKNKERRMQKPKDRKINILKGIDFAMLDNAKRTILKKEINKGLKDFKLSIPRTFEGIGKHGKYRTTAW